MYKTRFDCNGFRNNFYKVFFLRSFSSRITQGKFWSILSEIRQKRIIYGQADCKCWPPPYNEPDSKISVSFDAFPLCNLKYHEGGYNNSIFMVRLVISHPSRPDRKQMWRLWPVLALKFDSYIIKKSGAYVTRIFCCETHRLPDWSSPAKVSVQPLFPFTFLPLSLSQSDYPLTRPLSRHHHLPLLHTRSQPHLVL